MLVAVKSPSVAPPETASVDMLTDVRLPTAGQPQSAPKLVCATPVAADETAISAVSIIFDIVFFMFLD
ncbi:MAG: hypothetical protein BWY67_02020 [Bacteroidetes bacterium ADurb.Bin397]|nr:MAG: hypothetical protein BWY67_02020 [Bacteroidetes bacterium ADurb.Bin397]